ncbi:putative nonstructural protein [Orthohantavirus sinnombreense]|uniref:putative nonstructural protein n=1 Tax=Sin Nombre orthohantavirus TaxID=3052499 RepID=UPI000232E1D4|nr:putative nonstructural protein [Orthohantavirus sinnombreense]
MQKERWNWTPMMLTKAHYRADGQLCLHWRPNSENLSGNWLILLQLRNWLQNLLIQQGLNLMTI